VGFLGDAQELPALVFAILNEEVLAFYLQFLRGNDVVHGL
jgi:hypothetical protein